MPQLAYLTEFHPKDTHEALHSELTTQKINEHIKRKEPFEVILVLHNVYPLDPNRDVFYIYPKGKYPWSRYDHVASGYVRRKYLNFIEDVD